MFQNMRAAGLELPSDYAKFAECLSKAELPSDNVASPYHNEQFPAVPRVEGVMLRELKTGDLEMIKQEILSKMQDHNFRELYEPKSGSEATPNVGSDFYALDAVTLCGNERSSILDDEMGSRPVKVSVIKLDLLEKQQKQIVVQTVLQRLDFWQSHGQEADQAGSQEKSQTFVVIDETHEAMPKPAGPKQASEGTTGIISHIMRKHRSQGFCMCFGTHKPADLDSKALSFIQGGVFVGKSDTPEDNLKVLKDKLLGMGKATGGKRKAGSESSSNQDAMTQLRNLSPREFLFVTDKGKELPTKVKFGQVCRLADDAGPWRNQPAGRGQSAHPLVRHVHNKYIAWAEHLPRPALQLAPAAAPAPPHATRASTA